MNGQFAVDKVGCEIGRCGVFLFLVKEPHAHGVFAKSKERRNNWTAERCSRNLAESRAMRFCCAFLLLVLEVVDVGRLAERA